jgi:hypothetical protein
MSANYFTLAVVLCLPLAVPAQSPQTQEAKLPKTFTGNFAWRGEGSTRERVELVIEKVEEKDGVITFVGTQTYAGPMLKEKATGRIERKTGKFTMTMSDPSGPAVTDGIFQGTISAKLDAIVCVWDGQNGPMGDLKLTAREP